MEPTPQDLGVLFAPRSVAVIGATSRAGSVGQAVFANVFTHGYAGVVYPVNPKAPSVMSVKAFPSVLDIPDAVDLSIIIVPSALVPGVMEECGQKGDQGGHRHHRGLQGIGRRRGAAGAVGP